MKTLLITEDDVEIRRLVRATLAREGYRLVEAEDGIAGLEVARGDRPDLILVDVGMPRMDGFTMLAAIRADPHLAATPVILLTGKTDWGSLRRGMELGADDYIPKPFHACELVTAIRARFDRLEKMAKLVRDDDTSLPVGLVRVLFHELYTPLDVILNGSQIIRDTPVELPREESAKVAGFIHDAGKRLHRLFENILGFADLSVVEQDSAKLHEFRKAIADRSAPIIRDVTNAAASRAKRRSDISSQIEDARVRVSEDNLAKIAHELVENALKCSMSGTPIEVTGRIQGDDYVLTVVDRGRGMTPDQVASIGAFRQFDRRIHEQQGIGLGLAYVKRLVGLYGGLVDIRSVPGEGTSVSVFLPTVGPAGLPDQHH